MIFFARTTPTTMKPSRNDLRTTSMHSQQHPWTMRDPHHYRELGKIFKSILNNTGATQHGISSLRLNFMKQFVTGIGTRLMDILPQQQCAQKNGLHLRRIHITLQKPSLNDSRTIRTRPTRTHSLYHPKQETIT